MGCAHSGNAVTCGGARWSRKGRRGGGGNGPLQRNHYHLDPTRTERPQAPLVLLSGTGKQTLIALHDYSTDVAGDLSFRKGERLELLEADPSRQVWWMAARMDDGVQGYVPSNYVRRQPPFLDYPEWYFGDMTRKESERALRSPRATAGSFLIRMSETCPDAHVLSLRGKTNPRTGDISVRHYKIQTKSNGTCYIGHRAFKTCLDLVEFYRTTGEGLGDLLRDICPKEDLSRTRNPDKWEMDRRQLTFLERLGGGQFGEVWKGKYRGKKEVAIKTLRPDFMSPEKFLEEAQVMKQCQHEHLVTLHGVCSRAQPLYIVMELMPQGSLLSYLRDGLGRDSSMLSLMDMAAQVASGMGYLERHCIIHRDLAARNVLVGHNDLVKVADFGLARALDDGEYNPQQGGKFPIKWTAPEAALLGKFSVKSDVWSYGVLLHEVTTKGQAPYPDMNNKEVLEQVELGYRMARSPYTPEPVYHKMLQCWNRNAAQRPTFQHLHEFFEDYTISTESRYRELVTTT